MPQHTPLVSTIVVGLVLAFAFGAVAHRFKASPLVGYLLAGIVIGPFTPGFIADQNMANELSEIGIILLMFGVGLQFSMHELLSVRAIAVPGALAQIAVATALGVGLAKLLGWTLSAGLVFGVALSVASTVVVLRSLQERRLLDTERGRIAVGWLVVEDLAMVLVLVFLPALADLAKGASVNLSAVALPLAITLGKFAAFVALMWFVGRRVIPWLLHYVAHTGSRELFRLAVLAIALGVAYGAASLFEVSFALGAFFAGMILSESTLSQRAAQETLPLRDAFAVLFFVSVGMLFNPSVILAHPLSLLATLLIITVGKSAVAYLVMRLFRHSESTALMIAASRAQIGEFSFILAGLGVGLGLLPPVGRDLILAGALLSILATPFLFVAADWIYAHHEPPKKAPAEAPAAPEPVAHETPTREPVPVTHLTDHVVLVGYGRVGSVVGAALTEAKIPLYVIESDEDIVESLRKQGIEAITGNAADPELARAANYPAARCLLVAIPDGFEGGQVVEQAHAVNPKLPIIARAHSEEEIEHLKHHGATKVIMGEHLIAYAMIEDARAASIPASPANSAAPPATAPTGAATAEPPRPT
jgi:CPA2 family monovalent cation:H+ antiporter-2